jgi:hypothetical protein
MHAKARGVCSDSTSEFKRSVPCDILQNGLLARLSSCQAADSDPVELSMQISIVYLLSVLSRSVKLAREECLHFPPWAPAPLPPWVHVVSWTFKLVAGQRAVTIIVEFKGISNWRQIHCVEVWELRFLVEHGPIQGGANLAIKDGIWFTDYWCIRYET